MSEMIVAASEQMTELLEKLALAARIEGGRYDPFSPRSTRSRSRGRAVPDAEGEGTAVETDPPTIERPSQRSPSARGSTAAFRP